MRVSIEQQSDGSYIAYNTTGEGVQVIGTGETVEEAKEDFINSLAEVLESYVALGDTAPHCLSEDLDFRLDVRSSDIVG